MAVAASAAERGEPSLGLFDPAELSGMLLPGMCAHSGISSAGSS
jgi:hypothetical protein